MSEIEENQIPEFRITPMKKVLISLDFDPTAQKVAEEGYSLARAMNAQAFLLHVIAGEFYYSSLEYSPITGYSGFSSADFSLMASSEGLANASQYFLDKMKIHLNDDNIQTIVGKGELSDVILQTASNIRADLIVIGSHSRRWLEQILMGSVTEKVLHQTTVPLFIIPTKGKEKGK